MANVNVKQRSESIAAGDSNDNFFSGTRFEYAPADGYLNIYATASQLGANLRLLIGAGEAIENSELSARNAFPLVPDDLLMGGIPVFANQKITVQVQNTAGTATTAFVRIELEVA